MEKLKTGPAPQTDATPQNKRNGITNWGNARYIGSALQGCFDILDIQDKTKHPRKYNIKTKISSAEFTQIMQRIEGREKQTDHIPYGRIRNMVKAYNCTPGNMECAAEALIKILQDWSPSNEPFAYLYKARSHITINTCDRTNGNTATETLVQLYKQNYNVISDAIRTLQDHVQINNYTCDIQNRRRERKNLSVGGNI